MHGQTHGYNSTVQYITHDRSLPFRVRFLVEVARVSLATIAILCHSHTHPNLQCAFDYFISQARARVRYFKPKMILSVDILFLKIIEPSHNCIFKLYLSFYCIS